MKSRTIIFGFVSLLTSLAFASAQGEAVTQTSFDAVANKNNTAILLAQVNLYTPTVMKSSRGDGRYTASFILETLDPVQKDIRYRISLVDADNTLVYFYAFPNAVTLTKGIPVTISEQFPIPTDLNGTYKAIISAVNREGLPLANGEIQNVAFSSETPSLFAIESCVTDEPVYDKREEISVTCKISGNPSLGSTLLYTVYRNNRAQSYMKEAVSVNGKKMTFSFSAPARADAYTLMIQGLNNGALVGKTLSLPFVIRGTISNILSIGVDKQSYNKGDTASVNVGLNVFSATSQGIYAVASLKSADQTYDCGPLVRTRLSRPGGVSFAIPIVKDCDGFTLSINLTNEEGTVLDEEILSVDKLQSTRFIGFFNFFLIIASLYILLSAFVHRVHHKKHE